MEILIGFMLLMASVYGMRSDDNLKQTLMLASAELALTETSETSVSLRLLNGFIKGFMKQALLKRVASAISNEVFNTFIIVNEAQEDLEELVRDYLDRIPDPLTTQPIQETLNLSDDQSLTIATEGLSISGLSNAQFEVYDTGSSDSFFRLYYPLIIITVGTTTVTFESDVIIENMTIPITLQGSLEISGVSVEASFDLTSGVISDSGITVLDVESVTPNFTADIAGEDISDLINDFVENNIRDILESFSGRIFGV